MSKKYSIGGQQRFLTFRESLVELVRLPFKGSNRTVKDKSTFWALKDVNFEVMPGEILGIIGQNGAGKSTLLKILSRITEPTTGRIELYGRVGTLLEVGTGFHPELTGRENIFLNGAILGMTRQEVAKKFDEIVDFAEIEKFLDTAVKFYSSGMYMRLAFAVAAYLETEILIVDEVLAVGDVKFQNKCLSKMGEISQEGRTALFVSHDLANVRQLCTSAILLDQGNLKMIGTTDKVLTQYFESNEEISLDRIISKHGIQLSLLQIQDLNTGEITSFPIFNQSYKINFQLKAQSPFPNSVIYLDLYDEFGNLISVLSSLEEGINPFLFIGLVKGYFTLPKIQLLPGKYFISFFVCEYNDKNYFEAENCFTFEIQTAIVHDAASAYCNKGFGIVRVSDECNILFDTDLNSPNFS